MELRGNLVKAALALVIILVITSAFLGVFHGGTATMQMEGQSGACPFMPGVVICNMTPIQHIAAAQAMFNALPLRIDLASLLFLLLALIIGFAPSLRRSLFPPIATSYSASNRSRYVPNHNILQELFAGGIPNPKVF